MVQRRRLAWLRHQSSVLILLRHQVAAERDRMDPAGAARLLSADPAYASPFVTKPAGL